MAKTFIAPDLQAYIESVSLKEAEVLKNLRSRTAEMPEAGYQISADQGHFMGWLARLIGAKRYLEIGVFTGYSALCVTQAMGEGGQTVACDISTDFTDVGKPFWEEAGVASQIDLRIAPALESLDAMIADGTAPFDLAFIDPDKPNMPHYFERCLKLVRKGGLILSDNVLWSGRILNEIDEDPNTSILRKYNQALFNDDRVDLVLVPIGDGISMARVK